MFYFLEGWGGANLQNVLGDVWTHILVSSPHFFWMLRYYSFDVTFCPGSGSSPPPPPPPSGGCEDTGNGVAWQAPWCNWAFGCDFWNNDMVS